MRVPVCMLVNALRCDAQLPGSMRVVLARCFPSVEGEASTSHGVSRAEYLDLCETGAMSCAVLVWTVLPAWLGPPANMAPVSAGSVLLVC